MADDNQTMGITEPEIAESAPTSESAVTEASSAPADPDWHKALAEVPDEELEKHPKMATLLKRRGQAEADRILLKDRERIAKEERERVTYEETERQRMQYLTGLSDADYGRLLRQEQRYKDEWGKTVGEWWNKWSTELKGKIPEFKDKPIEEWQALLQKHPDSFADLMAEAINQAVEARFGKDLPKRVKEAAEASLKERVQKTIAGGHAPDLTSSPGSPTWSGMTPSQVRQRVKSMTPKEYAQQEEEILSSLSRR